MSVNAPIDAFHAKKSGRARTWSQISNNLGTGKHGSLPPTRGRSLLLSPLHVLPAMKADRKNLKHAEVLHLIDFVIRCVCPIDG
jgi:hypothetical protein